MAGEAVKGEDGFDEAGLEDARDFRILDLLEDVEPGVAGTEEETQLGQVEIGTWVRVTDPGDVELEDPIVGEAEFVEGNDGSFVGANLRGPDLAG